MPKDLYLVCGKSNKGLVIYVLRAQEFVMPPLAESIAQLLTLSYPPANQSIQMKLLYNCEAAKSWSAI